MYFSPMVPLIIGIGNTLMADDGVGPYAISLLEKTDLNADLLILDTPGFALLTHIQNRNKVIIVDAATFDAPPGAMARITRNHVREKRVSGLSLHDADPFAVYDYAEKLGLAPKELVIYAIRFESITPRQGLSPSVEKGARNAVDQIIKEISGHA
jgi:hydrogenase maturation protease